MRQKNGRLVMVGSALMMFVAPGFYLAMLPTAIKSNDPAAVMQTVGQVAGIVGAIGLVMIVVGLIGRRR